MTAAASVQPGHLWGVGVGPGDPELLTVKAVTVISRADVIVYHAGKPGSSIARRIAADHFPESVTEIELTYPVTTGITSHPGGYRAQLEEFYDTRAAALAKHLEAGRRVVVISEGDPMLYGSFQHLHRRLAPTYPTTIVPGVPAFCAAAAALQTPLVEHNQVLTILPGTLPTAQLVQHLGRTDAAVIMKLGRTSTDVRAALQDTGKLATSWYAERVSHPDQVLAKYADVADTDVPYMAVVVHPAPPPAYANKTTVINLTVPQLRTPGAQPGRASGGASVNGATPQPGTGSQPSVEDIEGASANNGRTHDTTRADRPTPGEVVVVGLGPGADRWLTPASAETLAAADHVIGYATYMNQVPVRPGQHRHASDNTDEETRAHHALQLAAAGAHVAVVSSGDPGVFAMATAVVEAGQCDLWAHIPIRVEPGVSAAQALAARSGAPLGHDFAMISLSERLKPWAVIEQRLRACASADMAMALYNPASRSRTDQFTAAVKTLTELRPPETVVVIGRSIGRPGETVTITTLADLPNHTITMAHLVIIGSSSTYTYTGPGGQRRVWTARRHIATPAVD